MKENLDSFFDKICEDYYDKVLKYAYFNIKNEVSARDITQDVFLIIYEKIEFLVNHPNIGGFVFQTAKNITRQYKRKYYDKIKKELNDEAIVNLSNNCDILDIIDKNINEFDYVSDVINSLSPEKRNLYELYYIKNKPMAEIAEELGIKHSTIRMRFVRLRNEIRKIVKRFADENF